MLIEVLVSIVIFSLGVIGLVGMQARATQASTDAQDRNTAAMLANSLSSQMWVSKSTSLSAADITAWKNLVAADLPNGVGAVTQVAAGSNAMISVTWLSPTRKSAPGTSDVFNKFVTEVVIPQ